MSRIKCPKCNELLDEVIRVIQVKCRFDEEADDYLTENDEGFTDLCPKCKTELEKT
jgi:hypothetical protein